jgi:hypothetical protein
MKHRHAARAMYCTVAWTCSRDIQHAHGAWTRSMDIQHGHAAWTYCIDMRHGMKHRNSEGTCSLNKQHGKAAGACNGDMHSFTFLKTLAFLCREYLGSGTGFPMWCGKGRKRHEFAPFLLGAYDFLRSFFFALPRSFLLLPRERKSAGGHLWFSGYLILFSTSITGYTDHPLA